MCAGSSCGLRLTHLTLVHVPRTLVVIGVGDEVGHHAQHTVREQFLVCGDTGLDLPLKDAHIGIKLQQGRKKTKNISVVFWLELP